jgi:hypothetical protein
MRSLGLGIAVYVGGLLISWIFVILIGFVEAIIAVAGNKFYLALTGKAWSSAWEMDADVVFGGGWPAMARGLRYTVANTSAEKAADGVIYALLVGVVMEALLGRYYAWPAKLAYLLAAVTFFWPYFSGLGDLLLYACATNIGKAVPAWRFVTLVGATAMFVGFLVAYNLYVWTGHPSRTWAWISVLVVLRYVLLYILGWVLDLKSKKASQ